MTDANAIKHLYTVFPPLVACTGCCWCAFEKRVHAQRVVWECRAAYYCLRGPSSIRPDGSELWLQPRLLPGTQQIQSYALCVGKGSLNPVRNARLQASLSSLRCQYIFVMSCFLSVGDELVGSLEKGRASRASVAPRVPSEHEEHESR